MEEAIEWQMADGRWQMADDSDRQQQHMRVCVYIYIYIKDNSDDRLVIWWQYTNF